VALPDELQGLRRPDQSTTDLERALQRFKRLLERKGGLDVSGSS
jgi:hypothetical protein